ncbi:MAG: hypothetical protein ACKVP7_12885 [Hyphomicrobiaceae bacterium]
MMAVKWIVLWGVTALGAAIAAGILASVRNRNHSSWAAWCFVFPPLLIVLILLPAYKGVLPPPRSMDDDDRERELA